MIEKTKFINNVSTIESKEIKNDFIQVLFKILDSPRFKDVIFWENNRNYIVINNTKRFFNIVLRHYFEGHNFDSFATKLMQYGFYEIEYSQKEYTYKKQVRVFTNRKATQNYKDTFIKNKLKHPESNKVQKSSGVQPDGDTSLVVNISTNPLKEVKKVINDLQKQVEKLKSSNALVERNIRKLERQEKLVIAELDTFINALTMKRETMQELLTVLEMDERQLKPKVSKVKATDISDTLVKNIYELNKKSNSSKSDKIDGNNPKIDHATAYQCIDFRQLSKAVIPLNYNNTMNLNIKKSSVDSNSFLGPIFQNKMKAKILSTNEVFSDEITQKMEYPMREIESNEIPILNYTKEEHLMNMIQIIWNTPPRILVVDDDCVYRCFSQELLLLIGCKVSLARNGVEALKEISLAKYDLIFMDVIMPRMDGNTASKYIRQFDTLTPIISMTSNFSDIDIETYIKSGMTDILPKPFTKYSLYQILEKYCNHLKNPEIVHLQNTPIVLPSFTQPINNSMVELAKIQIDKISETTDSISSSLSSIDTPIQHSENIYIALSDHTSTSLSNRIPLLHNHAQFNTNTKIINKVYTNENHVVTDSIMQNVALWAEENQNHTRITSANSNSNASISRSSFSNQFPFEDSTKAYKKVRLNNSII